MGTYKYMSLREVQDFWRKEKEREEGVRVPIVNKRKTLEELAQEAARIEAEKEAVQQKTKP